MGTGMQKSVIGAVMALLFCLPFFRDAGAASAPGAPATDAGAAAVEPPAEETLRALGERGRAVASGIVGMAKAREKMARQGQGVAKPDGVIGTLDHDLWRILFLKDREAEPAPGMPRSGTVVLAETEYGEAADDVGSLRVMSPPRPATSTMVSTLRAVQIALTEVGSRSKSGTPFDLASFRERDGTFTIYLLPQGAGNGSARFGGDFVVRVMSSGRQVMTVDAAHSTTIDVPLAGRAAGQPSLHSHASGDLPTVGDVALVRMHPSLAPHLVLTPHSMFRIDAEGSITWLGPNPVPSGASPVPAGSGL